MPEVLQPGELNLFNLMTGNLKTSSIILGQFSQSSFLFAASENDVDLKEHRPKPIYRTSRQHGLTLQKTKAEPEHS
jgi:hypothetical protein